MGALYDNKTYKGLVLHPGCPFDYCVDTPVHITLDDLDVQCNYTIAQEFYVGPAKMTTA